jgi:hypothetical protein
MLDIVNDIVPPGRYLVECVTRLLRANKAYDSAGLFHSVRIPAIILQLFTRSHHNQSVTCLLGCQELAFNDKPLEDR